MMTETPARILGVNRGKLEAGLEPDIVAFDDEIKIAGVFVGGKKVF